MEIIEMSFPFSFCSSITSQTSKYCARKSCGRRTLTFFFEACFVCWAVWRIDWQQENVNNREIDIKSFIQLLAQFLSRELNLFVGRKKPGTGYERSAIIVFTRLFLSFVAHDPISLGWFSGKNPISREFPFVAFFFPSDRSYFLLQRKTN